MPWLYLLIQMQEHAEIHGKALFISWREATFTDGSRANVLIARDLPPLDEIKVNYVSSRWCVDSGANRDICREISMAQGRDKAKQLTIGEAGRGHSFTSEAEGPISISVAGRQLPFLSRTIFAKGIHENIFSVAEAVDKGFTLVFTAKGVRVMKANDVVLRGAAVLSGLRDPCSRLFYFDFSDSVDCKAAAVVPHTSLLKLQF